MSIALPQRRLVSQNDQNRIESPHVQRSVFLNQWTRKTTFNQGAVVPFMVDELLPGDHMVYDATAYLRLATPLFPIFDNLRVDTHWFFVPIRLVWSNFVKMMGQQDNPGDSIAYTVPYTDSPAGGFAQNSLADHMGLPCAGQITAGQVIRVNVLPFRAYNRIWNEWFRDQDLQNRVFQASGDGPDVWGTNYGIAPRAKSHDYFTSARPWPQKFTPPAAALGGNASIRGAGFDAAITTSLTSGAVRDFGLQSVPGGYGVYYDVPNTWVEGTAGAYADLSTATGVTINALRQAWLVQELLERDARGGTRYTEIVLSHFKVRSPDMRLQRPELIGAGSSPLVITPIAQTAPTAGATVGALGAAGTAVGEHRASYAATEHGYVLGLISVKSEISYQQGLHKMWTRSSRFDFYWPPLDGLGEQAVLRQEIYCTGVDADDATVFGYMPRWDEYRQRYSEVTGMFRSTHTGTLDAWHLAQRFTVPPVLGNTFIIDSAPVDRVIAAGLLADNQQILADIQIRRKATRPISMYGTPVALGRF